MKITISAELTAEQVQILSTKKGYSETIFGEPNTQSREEYLKEVYTGIIMADATNVFISYTKEQRAEQERLEEETIRANVSASITSSIE